jgi:cytochrome c peroxidase
MGKEQTKKKHYYLIIGVTAIIFGVCMVFGYDSANGGDHSAFIESDIELLGKYIFWDKISEPERMACVTCHNPKAGWTFGVAGTNKSQVAVTGADSHTVGSLKVPTNAYATFIEPFGSNPAIIPSGFSGGNFWNGRAEGNLDNIAAQLFPAGATKHIGDEIFFDTDGSSLPAFVSAYEVFFGPTADQALNPMPNPVEQNIDRQAVCEHVKSSDYAPLYEIVWGVEIDCSDDPVLIHAADVANEKAFDISFKRLMLAVCAYQDSNEVNSFSSKRDIALAAETDGAFPLGGFTDQENLGHDLFYGTNESGLNTGGPGGAPKNARCAGCHQSGPPALLGTDPEERYTDDGFHFIGVPVNTEIPDTGNNPDLGLEGHTGNPLHIGLQKTPTLRNVAKGIGEGFTKAYTHNGFFKSLESIVHFYNTAAIGLTTANSFGVTRCLDGIVTEKDALANNCWPPPAVASPLSAIPFVVGNLGLTTAEEAAIIAYLHTLSDTFTAQAPKPYKKPK